MKSWGQDVSFQAWFSLVAIQEEAIQLSFN